MTKRALLALFALCLALGPVPARAQGQAEYVDLAAMTRIRDEGFRNSKVMDTIGYLTDVIGARLTGSPQHRRSAEWTRDQLASWGLQNAQLHKWGPFGRGWTYESATVRMIAPTTAPLFAIPKAWTPGTNGPVRGKVVRMPKLPDSEESFAPFKGKLAGAVILVGAERKLEPLATPLAKRYTDEQLADVHQYEIPGDRSPFPFDREAFRRQIAFSKRLNELLAEEKAAAVIEGSGWDRGVVRIGGAGSREPGEPVGVPQLVMAIEHFNRLQRILDREMDVELEVDVRASFYDEDLHSYNVIAEIPGTDPKLKDEIVMIGAHLDSWHPGTGATDNAAGSAVAMEAIRILQSLGIKPRRTIRIGLWSGEEQGLLGSRAYVSEMYASRPEPTDPEQKRLPSFLRESAGPLTVKPAHAKVSAYFNLDNGTGKIRGIYAQENAAVVPIFRAWLEPFADLGATTVSMRNTGSTDHMAFDSVGIPGFQFIQDAVEYADNDGRGLTHHSNMDVYDRAQRQDLMQASVIMAAFLYNAAMRQEMLPRKPMPKDPPARGQGRGYEEDHDH